MWDLCGCRQMAERGSSVACLLLSLRFLSWVTPEIRGLSRTLLSQAPPSSLFCPVNTLTVCGRTLGYVPDLFSWLPWRLYTQTNLLDEMTDVLNRVCLTLNYSNSYANILTFNSEVFTTSGDIAGMIRRISGSPSLFPHCDILLLRDFKVYGYHVL